MVIFLFLYFFISVAVSAPYLPPDLTASLPLDDLMVWNHLMNCCNMLKLIKHLRKLQLQRTSPTADTPNICGAMMPS